MRVCRPSACALLRGQGAPATVPGVTRVLLVEDDATVTAVVEVLLSTEPGLELVGTATSAEDALDRAPALAPDVVLLDDQLEGALGGLQAAPLLHQALPGVLVVLFSALEEAATAGAPGVDARLRKDRLVELPADLQALLAAQPGSA